MLPTGEATYNIVAINEQSSAAPIPGDSRIGAQPQVYRLNP